MSAENDCRGTPAQSPDKASPAYRGRDRRKAAHFDASESQCKESADDTRNDDRPTHGPAAFLWETPADTPVSELGDAYRQWYATREAPDTPGRYRFGGGD